MPTWLIAVIVLDILLLIGIVILNEQEYYQRKGDTKWEKLQFTKWTEISS